MVLAVGAALVVAVVARFATVAHMWLDEALTVNIARLPLGDISGALRHDGSPPFYYLALHAWMTVFGHGDVAVRAFSGVLAVAALPLAWLAGPAPGWPGGGLGRPPAPRLVALRHPLRHRDPDVLAGHRPGAGGLPGARRGPPESVAAGFDRPRRASPACCC